MGTVFKIYEFNSKNNKTTPVYFDDDKWKNQFNNFINHVYIQILNGKRSKSNLENSIKTNYICDYFLKKAKGKL